MLGITRWIFIYIFKTYKLFPNFVVPFYNILWNMRNLSSQCPYQHLVRSVILSLVFVQVCSGILFCLYIFIIKNILTVHCNINISYESLSVWDAENWNVCWRRIGAHRIVLKTGGIRIWQNDPWRVEIMVQWEIPEWTRDTYILGGTHNEISCWYQQ